MHYSDAMPGDHTSFQCSAKLPYWITLWSCLLSELSSPLRHFFVVTSSFPPYSWICLQICPCACLCPSLCFVFLRSCVLHAQMSFVLCHHKCNVYTLISYIRLWSAALTFRHSWQLVQKMRTVTEEDIFHHSPYFHAFSFPFFYRCPSISKCRARWHHSPFLYPINDSMRFSLNI